MTPPIAIPYRVTIRERHDRANIHASFEVLLAAQEKRWFEAHGFTVVQLDVRAKIAREERAT
jgi:hypothetical protein